MSLAGAGTARSLLWKGLIVYIGLGIVLLVVGLILALDVITVDLNFVDDGMLGGILIAAGILAIVLSLVIAPPWRRTAVTDYPDRPLR